LVERAKGGDAQAFRDLVERSRQNVYRLAYNLTGNRLDAEDLSQDVFIKAYRSLPKFRGDAKWSTWLYRITVNTCMDHGRTKAGKKMESSFNQEETQAEYEVERSRDAVSPDRKAESAIIQEQIESAMNALTEQERSVFVLRHYHDFSLKQIAETLEIAEGTVKAYLFRAVRRLQEKLSFYRNDLGLREQL
jgi:RNA polymerase sigma-70 factor (ECF subfamily)